jgi:hypothetical protein
MTSFDAQDIIAYFKRTGKPIPPELQDIKKPPKYHNRKTPYNGEMYDSQKEANRAWELDQLKKSKQCYFFRQLPFQLPGGIEYRCDFLVLYPDGRYEIEDVKGGEATKTKEYKLKKKLMESINLKIKEV